MSEESVSPPDIMNVREIIEYAFGDFHGNTVNFKLVQTVLLLLARQLRVLERRVEVELGSISLIPLENTLTITEVKIQAAQKKGKKPKPVPRTKPKMKGQPSSSSDKTSTDKTSTAKTYTDKTSSDKTSTDKTSTDKTSTDKTSTDKTSTDKTSTDKTSTDKTSTDKTSTDKTSTDKTSTDKTSTDKTSTDKTSTDKTSTDKTSTDKTSTDKTFTDKTSTDKTTTTDKTPRTDKTTTTYETTSSTDKTTTTFSTDPTSIDKTASSDRSTSGQTSTPASKRASVQKPFSNPDILSALEEQRERELRIIHQRADSFAEATKSPTPMASVTSMQKQYETLLVVKKVPSTESRTKEAGQQRSPQISVVTQEQFEKVANAVRQLEKKFLPIGTPGFPEHGELMEQLRKNASLTDAMAALQLSARLEATEKVLNQMIGMVTDLAAQTPAENKKQGISFGETKQSTPEFGGGGARSAPEFGGGGARSTPRLGGSVAPSSAGFGGGVAPSTAGLSGTLAPSSPRLGGGVAPSSAGFGGGVAPSTAGFGGISRLFAPGSEASKIGPTKSITGGTPTTATLRTMSRVDTGASTARSALVAFAPDGEIPPEDEPSDSVYVSFSDLQRAAKELYDEILKKLKSETNRTTTTADTAYRMSLNLESKLDRAIKVSSRMGELENVIKQYADQVTALDTGLSSQMTSYQEQLTQMQHDLEIGVETISEVLATASGDVEAVAELHSNFTNLQGDLEVMGFRQKELRDSQNSTSYDLENLWKEIEMLRDTKSDREEVADALRDKAGIAQLNGLVGLAQFEAVRGDFEKRIGAAYDKFNNQEHVWQKSIDELVKVLNEKGDYIQIETLRDDINKHLTILKTRMRIIADIVGEPKSAMVNKKVFRDAACLSCGSPAHMDLEEPNKIPALPKFPSDREPADEGEAESQIKGAGDSRPCYPDMPIPHPRDPRAHICKRYCGGSHTVVTDGLNRTLPGLVVLPADRAFNTAPGTDGKLYMVDEQTKKVPCLPCNLPKILPVLPEPEPPKPDSIDEMGVCECDSWTPPAEDLPY